MLVRTFQTWEIALGIYSRRESYRRSFAEFLNLPMLQCLLFMSFSLIEEKGALSGAWQITGGQISEDESGAKPDARARNRPRVAQIQVENASAGRAGPAAATEREPFAVVSYINNISAMTTSIDRV